MKLNYKIKVSFVFRRLFFNERACDLGQELIQQKLSIVKDYHYGRIRFKPGAAIISNWVWQYKNYGIKSLFKTFMSYKPKKKLTRQEALDSLTTEEKDELINVLIDILEKKGIDKSQIKQEVEKTKVKASNRKVIAILDIPESTFYYKRQNNHERMKHYEYIESFTIKLFHNTGECMGARKLTKIMHDKYAIRVSKNTVQKFMNIHNLHPYCNEHKRKDPKNTKVGFDNLCALNSKPTAPHQIYTTDITYIRSFYAKNGFYYLTFYVDLFNNEISGIELSDSPNVELVINSAQQIITFPGTIMHQDHGSQYTSKEYISFLNKNQLRGSMSSVGKSLENRPSEYANGRIKLECIYKIPENERTYKNLIQKIKQYVFNYNNYRIQSCLNDMSPVQFRESWNLANKQIMGLQYNKKVLQ